MRAPDAQLSEVLQASKWQTQAQHYMLAPSASALTSASNGRRWLALPARADQDNMFQWFDVFGTLAAVNLSAV
jgi:hypothetical protein